MIEKDYILIANGLIDTASELRLTYSQLQKASEIFALHIKRENSNFDENRFYYWIDSAIKRIQEMEQRLFGKKSKYLR